MSRKHPCVGRRTFPCRALILLLPRPGKKGLSLAHSLSLSLFLRFCVLGGSFRFRAKLKGRYRGFADTFHPHTGMASRRSMSPPEGVFVTVDEPAQTHHRHPESTVYRRVTLGAVRSVGLDTCPSFSVRQSHLPGPRALWLRRPVPPSKLRACVQEHREMKSALADRPGQQGGRCATVSFDPPSEAEPKPLRDSASTHKGTRTPDPFP